MNNIGTYNGQVFFFFLFFFNGFKQCLVVARYEPHFYLYS